MVDVSNLYETLTVF